jgi:hypothetical protein
MHNQSPGNSLARRLRARVTRSLPFVGLLLTLGLLLPRPAHAQPPTPNTVWILAEGASNSFFEEDILIGNPNTTATQVRVTLFPEGGTAIVVPAFSVAATSRYTFEVEDFLPQGGSVSAMVESLDDHQIVVERTMTWANGLRRGGHNSPGVPAAAPTWYLAEGVTGFFSTFILITNPGTTAAAQVEVKYLREFSGPITQSIVVPTNGRVTIPVNAGLDLNGDGTPETTLDEPFSTVVTSTNAVNIAVERAMYWNDFEGGHESTAVTAPNRLWLFAEGVTGGGSAFSWDTYLLLANPQNTDANVTVTFFRQDGGPLTYQTTVAANKRRTIQVGSLDIDNDGTPDLPSGSFSTRIESTNDVAIIAERAMYWSSNGITYIEGHDTPGVNAEALKWAFAEGAEGRIDESNIPYSSFFLVSNATGNELKLRATFVREDGTGIVKTFDVPAQSRFTIPTGSYPELRHKRFAAFLESTNSVPFVSERAVYWGDGFYGGTASVGTPWTAAFGTPPVAVLTPTIATIAPNTGTAAGGTVVTITGTNFVDPLSGPLTGTRVRFGTLDAAAVNVINSTTLTATTPAAPGAGAVDVVVSNHHIDPAWAPVTSTGGFTYTAVPTTPPPPPPTPPALPDVQAQIQQWTNERLDLFARQCEAGVKYVNSPWQDFIVDRLRQSDPRWGYNGKPTRTAADNGGRPVVAAGDELAYFYGTGNAQGSTDVYLVDILLGHCGPSPALTWRVFTGEEPGFWTGAGRF